MSDLQVFDFQGFDVRVVTVDGNPWWVAKDVCDVLGYADSASNAAHIIQRLDNDEKDKISIPSNRNPVSNLQKPVWCVNEPGLYSLILWSTVPGAKEFKRWVTHEVLPAIRTSGGYINKAVDPLDAIIAMATEMKAQRARIEKIEQAQHQLLNPPDTGYVTVRGYFNLKNRSVGEVEAAKIGKEATKLCRENGYTIEQVRDNRYGRVNSYPMAVLRLVIGDDCDSRDGD